MQNRYDNIERIANYRGPLLQTHGTQDEIVPITFARRLFDVAPCSPKRWIELPGLGHNSGMPRSYYDQLAAFLASVDGASDSSVSP
jgi:fermentation-respiration switch protein FrsA (DUF1100 family)